MINTRAKRQMWYPNFSKGPFRRILIIFFQHFFSEPFQTMDLNSSHFYIPLVTRKGITLNLCSQIIFFSLLFLLPNTYFKIIFYSFPVAEHSISSLKILSFKSFLPFVEGVFKTFSVALFSVNESCHKEDNILQGELGCKNTV